MIEKRLIDVSRNISSGITPLRSNDEFWTDGTIPWLKTEQLGEKYIFDTNEHITEKALQEANVKIFPENTLSIAMYGEVKTRGNVSILKRPMATNQACCNIELDEEKVSSEYVYYFLKTQYENLRGLSSGIRKNLNTNDIKNFVVRLPENLKTQQSIATVLSVLDKKIALNKQINARLEEMAKTLYDYWFVQFDFPDANGKPYKSSGGEMVFDETLKREIPKGWEVKSLKDVLVNRSDNIKSEDLTSNMPYTPIDSLPMRKMTFSDFQKIENARTSLIRYSFNDILIGAMRVYFHRVCIAPFNGITRSTTIVLKPKKQNHLPFLYQLCNEEKTINFASKVSIGTQQPYVNWVNGLAEYKFAMPNLELIERYSIKIMPLIKSVITREKQNHQLTQLRDFLLPMLMNGQVSVAE